jgi:hypothetical protein
VIQQVSVQRVYVGEPGGENLDVGRANEAKQTAGQVRFVYGDIVSIPNDLAKRLGPEWVTEEEAKKRGVTEKTEKKNDAEGGDES